MIQSRLEATSLSRRNFLSSVLAAGLTGIARAQPPATRRLLLRSSWQTVNIGDIAHTPGMLTLLEQHLSDVEVTLWPSSVADGVRELLEERFPRLKFAVTAEEREAALHACDFCLHGSGPGLVGWRELELWRETGKPYGFGGITLNDAELRERHELLCQAAFVFCRDTDSLQALRTSLTASGVTAESAPVMEFGPDATFAMDLRDGPRASAYLDEHNLIDKEFICAVPRLRYTPYWLVHPERYPDQAEVARREQINEQYRDIDHAKLRMAIVAWVRETGNRVLLCPEMTYQVELLGPLLYDPLPDDIKPYVVTRPGYWTPGEAASIYSRSFAVVSCEMHSPIIAFASGRPAIHLRQPTDTRKGQMWRDIGLSDWIFEIDETGGEEIAARLLTMYAERESTRDLLAGAQERVLQRSTRMMQVLDQQFQRAT